MQATTATCRTGRASMPGSVNSAAYRRFASTSRSVTDASLDAWAADWRAGRDAEVVMVTTLVVTGPGGIE